MAQSSVTIQITPEPSPSTPPWMGEVAAFAQVLSQTGILKTIQEQVRFARARFGIYDLIDFVVVLIGYAVSGKPTLKAFKAEIAKCDVLYGNCHAIETQNQRYRKNGIKF